MPGVREAGVVALKHNVPVQSLIDHIKTAVDVDPWAKDMAEELLKERKPKQIIRKQAKRNLDDGSVEYFAEWYCPHCKLLLVRGFENKWIEFCPKCGKPISWEGR